ncbi:hypothetical protein RHSIM_Rhsim06G0101300 [Rhododendron simsii]|uniref:Uncharacterized protein n=1 Tax=Rhododendron simsii TaxID=118357 RepID=A0A834GR85_RHOSS|nr:hypothetical protein RHSIM_Rhsim06G0101300 [Rhododendron simsii]
MHGIYLSGQKSGGQELIGGLDCTVHRNFFGSQIQSFEAELPVPQIADKEGGPPTFRAVFIRAPAIPEVGPEVVVLADIPVSSNKADNPNLALESTESYALNGGSDDCGVHTAKYFDLEQFNEEEAAKLRFSSEEGRNSLILDLILCGENIIRNEVIRKAQENYRNSRRII